MYSCSVADSCLKVASCKLRLVSNGDGGEWFAFFVVRE